MANHLIVTLEFDMGDYSDMEDDGLQIPTDPKDIGLNESFYQGDATIRDMKIIGVRYVRSKHN